MEALIQDAKNRTVQARAHLAEVGRAYLELNPNVSNRERTAAQGLVDQAVSEVARLEALVQHLEGGHHAPQANAQQEVAQRRAASVPKELAQRDAPLLTPHAFEQGVRTFRKILRAHAQEADWDRLLPLALDDEDALALQSEIEEQNEMDLEAALAFLRTRVVSAGHLLASQNNLRVAQPKPGESMRSFATRYKNLALEARREPDAEMFLLSLPDSLQRSIGQARLAQALAQGLPQVPAFATFEAASQLAIECERLLGNIATHQAPTQSSGGGSSKKPRHTCEIHGPGHPSSACRILKARRVAGEAGSSQPSEAPARENPTAAANHVANVTCFVCNKKGHYASGCPNKQHLQVMEAEFDEWANALMELPAQLNALQPEDEAARLSPSRVLIPISINGIEVDALVDSGASASFISTALAKRTNTPVTTGARGPTPLVHMGTQGQSVRAQGTTGELLVRTEHAKAQHRFIVLDNLRHQAIIGLDLFAKLGIELRGLPTRPPRDDSAQRGGDAHDRSWIPARSRPRLTTPHSDEERTRILAALQPLLDELKAIPNTTACSEATIALPTGDAEPCARRQYPIPERWRPYVAQQVEEWLRDGKIEEADPDALWESPLMAAPKFGPDGNLQKVRVCIDPRHINKVLVNDPLPLPAIADIIANLKGKAYLSKIDLWKGFQQVPLLAEDRNKTTFRHGGKRYRFVRATWGFSNMSSAFQRVMEKVLHDMPFVAIYIDDIVISSDTLEEHIDHVKQVLQRLRDANLKPSTEKCAFGFSELDILGHFVSAEHVRPDPAKLGALAQAPRPTTGKQVQALLGLLNYLRDYIPLYSRLMAPFERLRHIKVPITWNDALERAWQRAKAVLEQAPVLWHYNPALPLCVGVDASLLGVGAVLFQKAQDGSKRILRFAAKSLTPAQRNYPAGKRELLAIIFALRSFHQHIAGQRFELFTDHKPLSYLLTAKHPQAMLSFWADQVLQHDFTLTHCPGIDNILPDALSRLFAEDSSKEGGNQQTSELNVKIVNSTELAKFLLGKREVTDDKEKKEMLEHIHRTRGHTGANALFKQLLEVDQVVWKGMRRDCERFIEKCRACQACNVAKVGYHPLQSVEAPTPFDLVSVDLFGPMTTTERGSNYALIVVDVASRFSVLRPLQSKSALDTARALLDIFYEYGFPLGVNSDGGREFVNELLRKIEGLANVKHRATKAYDPNANGNAESHVKLARQILRKTAVETGEDAPRNWDELLPAVAHAMNARFSRRHLSTPGAAFFGRPFLPIAHQLVEIERDSATPSETTPMSAREIDERITKLNETIWPSLAERTREYASDMQQSTDKKRPEASFKPGDSVMRQLPPRSKKSGPRFEGPFKVIAVEGAGVRLTDETGNLLPGATALHRLKLISTPGDDAEEYEVEAIRRHRSTKARGLEFFVKWAGYPEAENTWEPLTHLTRDGEPLPLLAEYAAKRRIALPSSAKELEGE
jgi:hypothetical protein